MATPKKLKNGRWRSQVYIGKAPDGHRVYTTITADTKSDLLWQIALAKEKGIPAPKPKKKTVGEVVDRYIDSCATLSPTTIAGYRKIRKNMFPELMNAEVTELTSEVMQYAINAETRRTTERRTALSAKTIKNAYGLISAALRYECGMAFIVKLPKEAPKFIELPEPEEVLKAIEGTDIELPCTLALWLSLSMSEVRGLKYSSIRNGCLYIDQVVVDVDGISVEKKQAKAASRNRVLAIPKDILDLIRKTTDYDRYLNGEIPDDYLWPYSHDKIRHGLDKCCPGLTFHQLRHMNASIMLRLNIPDKYAMERGGWSTPSTMKKIYQHTFSSERRRVDVAIDRFFHELKNQKAEQKCKTNMQDEAETY